MAKSINEEELQLRKRARRRLVGAIALVTIIAVFLPMVLDHEPKPVSQDVSIKIPSPDSGAFTSKIVPVAPAAKAAPEAAAKPEASAQQETSAPPATPEPSKIAAVPAAKPAPAGEPPAYDTEASPPKKAAAPAKPIAKPVVAEKAKTAKTAAAPKPAEKIKPAAKGTAGYVVQVAALNDADKARQMRDQIAAAGVKAYTEVVPTTKGNVTRVRAGPFAARGDADKARDKLKTLGLSGNVIPK